MRKYGFAVALALFVSSAAYGQCFLTFQTETLAPFQVGRPANFQIEAVSGTEPYRFQINEVFGPLPEGLRLTPNGKIVGVPREPVDTISYVNVTDDAGCTLTQAYTVVVLE